MAEDLKPPTGSPQADGGADAQPDDGFTPEERSQFESMREADAAPADPGSAPAGDAPAVAADGAAAAAAGKAPAAGDGAPAAGAAAAGEGEDDGEDDGEPAAAAGQPGADPAARPPKRVAYGRFLRTENRAKAAEAARTASEERARVAEDRLARGDERLKILTEAITTPKAAAGDQQQDDDPKPDKEADVFAYLAWQERRQERLEKELSDMRSGEQAKNADTSLATAYMDDARAFAAKEPDFVDAYQHLMLSRTAEVALYFFGKDLTEEGVALTQPELQRVKSTIAEEEKQLAAAALKAGQSPAQRVFTLAKSRGWTKPAAADGGARPAANGAAAPAGGQKPTASAAKPNVKDEIDRIKAGQDASLSLSNAGGAPANPLTAAKLADMPQDQFNALVENLSPEEFRRIVEGTG